MNTTLTERHIQAMARHSKIECSDYLKAWADCYDKLRNDPKSIAGRLSDQKLLAQVLLIFGEVALHKKMVAAYPNIDFT
jgi:hypothetical protein